MNKRTPTLLAITLFAATLAFAGDEHRQDHKMGSHGMQSSGGMMNHDAMQSRMQTMRETMQQIQKTEDPAERRQLMREHMQQMHDAMGEMGRMGHQGGGMKGNMMNMDADQCREMMQTHAGMMQAMMEQMGAHMQESGRHRRN